MQIEVGNQKGQLVVVYDPDFGLCVPDNKVRGSIREWYNHALQFDGYKVRVGNELPIHAIRLAIKRKEFELDKVVIKFGEAEDTIQFDSDGRTRNWPPGFCDATLKILEQLL